MFFSLAVAIAGAFIFGGSITGLFGLETLTSGRNAFPNGTTAVLYFDNYSSTYVDNSFVNPNVFAELCSDDPTNDLLDKYLSVYVVMGNNSINLGVMPVQMVASTINGGCAFVDVDLSLFSAFYPAIVSLGVSNYANMSGVSFYNLTIANGFLQGNFTIDPVNETPTNVTVTVRFPVDENNNSYYVENERLIVGIRNSSLDLVDSVITTLDSPVTLLRPAGGYIITINNIDGTGIFVPIVDIITPADDQNVTAGTPVLITVNSTGNVSQVLVNVSWDSTSELLNATFNLGTGLWEASFTNTSALGLYNITAFAYAVDGGVGNDSSFFNIVAGPSEPVVDIITPTGGQSITAGSSVLITVNSTGNLSQELVNVSWDSTSELLNATFNLGTGLWEASFTNAGALGLYNIIAFAYDFNGSVGNDSSFFNIVAGPSGGGGGGSGGRNSGVMVAPVVPPPIVPPVVTVPPAVEEAVAVPVAPPAVAVPVAPVAAPEEEAEAITPCFIVKVSSYILLVLLLACVFFCIVYTYILKHPVGRWLEWLVWILIVVLLALILIYNLLCEGVLWLPLLDVFLVLLLLLLKFVLSKKEEKPKPVVERKVVHVVKEEYNYVMKARNDLDKEMEKLEKSIRRMRK